MASGLLSALAILAAPAMTRAEPERDPAAALELFDRGKELQAAGDWAAACSRFQASMDLNPATGTLIRIARCHEHEGKLARAWADYQAALTLNRALSGRTAERRDELRLLAEKELAALGPRVPRLRVVLREPPPALRLWRDGKELPAAALGEELPVDPGAVEIAVEAPGYRTVRREAVAVQGRVTVVELALERIETPPTAAPVVAAPTVAPASVVPPPAPGVRPLGGQRIAGLAVSGAGVAVLGLSLGFGIDAYSKAVASAAYCTPDDLCVQRGVDLRDQARGSQTVALVTLGFGAALAVTGIALFVTATPRRAGPASLKVALGPSSATLRAAW